MKAKLIKDHTDYHLVDNKHFIIGTTDKRMLSCTDKHKLSLKNCQAIERGYDLRELAKKYTSISSVEFDAFEVGFQKALELMGDKKFSEEDVRKAMDLNRKSLWTQDESIQSLQQTEWDVEIKMAYQGIEENGKIKESYMPKLDTEGCLILKRI